MARVSVSFTQNGCDKQVLWRVATVQYSRSEDTISTVTVLSGCTTFKEIICQMKSEGIPWESLKSILEGKQVRYFLGNSAYL